MYEVLKEGANPDPPKFNTKYAATLYATTLELKNPDRPVFIKQGDKFLQDGDWSELDAKDLFYSLFDDGFSFEEISDMLE